MRLLITALLLSCPATWTSAAEGDVSLAGQVLLRIRYPAAGYSVAQRAEAVGMRLNSVLSMEQVGPGDVAVRQINRETALVVRDQLVITVDWPTARFNKTTPEELAVVWANNLRRVLPIAVPRRTGSWDQTQVHILCKNQVGNVARHLCQSRHYEPSTG